MFFWLCFLLLWQITFAFANVPVYFIPKPSDILFSLYTNHNIILDNTIPFIYEVLLSFLITVMVGYGLALSVSEKSEDTVSSFVLTLQSIPRIIIGPFIIIWFGFTLFSKVILAVFIGFLAIFINSYRGLKNVDDDILDMANTYTGSYWKILYKIKIPNSLPYFFTGMKIATPIVIGGIVLGEWFIGGTGLGYLVFASSSTFDTPLALASVMIISLICVIIYKLISFVERYV